MRLNGSRKSQGARTDPLRLDRIALLALWLTWVGMWGAWIPHHTASLTQNAIYLAEWSDVLLEVRAGPLAGVPNLLRLALALAVVGLAIALGSVRQVWLRWVLRGLSSLPGLVLLPPYPQVLSLWHSDVYGVRFVVAMVLWAGLVASALTDLLPPRVRSSLVGVLSVVAAGLGGWSFLILRRPFEVRYAHSISAGWGVLAFVFGLMVAALLQVAMLRCARWDSASGSQV